MESESFEKIEWSEKAEELREKHQELIKKDAAGTWKKIGEFSKKLTEQHPFPEELFEYEAYRVLIGSTPPKKLEKFDLEGDESIVRFIDTLAEKMERSEEKDQASE